MNPSVKLGVSPTAASTPLVFSISGLRLYFPTLELWVVLSVAWSTSCCLTGQLQLCPPCSTICHLAGSASRPPPCCESSLPGFLSPPLLLVWMNVSSLSLWLSDFHTVRFSVSSGCVLFLNCYCPSFGCARRHSVYLCLHLGQKSPK